MPVAVAFLRAINVGGHNMVAMRALRELCDSLGLAHPQTWLQSGNVVFETTERDLKRVGERLEEALETAVGFRPAVIVRSALELAKVAATHPFEGSGDIDPARLLVLFLAADPGKVALAKAVALATESELIRTGKRELYVYFSNGLARPKLPPTAIEKVIGVAATGRNWNTVNRLVQLAGQREGR